LGKFLISSVNYLKVAFLLLIMSDWTTEEKAKMLKSLDEISEFLFKIYGEISSKNSEMKDED